MSSSELMHWSTALRRCPPAQPGWEEHSLLASALGSEKVQNAVNMGLPPSVQMVSKLLGQRAEAFLRSSSWAGGSKGNAAEQAPCIN